jgi:hypothetical protein
MIYDLDRDRWVQKPVTYEMAAGSGDKYISSYVVASFLIFARMNSERNTINIPIDGH